LIDGDLKKYGKVFSWVDFLNRAGYLLCPLLVVLTGERFNDNDAGIRALVVDDDFLREMSLYDFLVGRTYENFAR
jgi:hypothetical protein